MKKLFFLISFCTSFISVAQNLESKIPSNAQAVISVNGNRLLELMSIAEFDQLNIAKELFKNANKSTDSTAKIASLKDFGFKTNSKAYYFYQPTDSINYHHFIIKLNDKNLFEGLLSKSETDEIERNDVTNILTQYSNITVWNDNMLLFTKFDGSYQYFKKNEERFLKQAENEDESIYSVEKRLTKTWTKNHALAIFNNKSTKSILTNSSYTKRKDEKAVASFWIDNYGELIETAMLYSLRSLFMPPDTQSYKNRYGVDDVWGNFYLEDDAVRLTASMEINEEWRSIYKKMYRSKIGNEFFQYFDQDNVLGYASISFNMQGTLEEYPNIVSNIYSGMMPKYKEEIEVAAEVTSVLLDEKAIGNAITGNMLYILNDISEKEVTYTSYEYDDDYKKTEVTKTKKETIPDFTVMIGSKNKKLLDKLIHLGVKHKLVNPQAKYFKVKKEDNIPFDLFFVVKNNIAFLTSSEKQIKDIVNDKVNSNSGKHKKMMRKNISVFYVNGKKIMHKIPKSILSKSEMEIYNLAKDNLSEAYLTISKMKGNKVHVELKMDTPTSHKNSLKYFLSFF